MKYTREQLISLRKKLISFLIDTHKDQITELTDLLIEYPSLSYCETSIKDVNRKWIKRCWTSSGHGAFGEPEGYSTERILGWNIDSIKLVLFDEMDTPIKCSSLDIESLIEEVKNEHIKSFKL